MDDNGLTSNVRTVDILEVLNNEFLFIDSKVDTSKNLFISGKHVDDFYAIDYLALIPLLIKSIQELNDRIKIYIAK